MAAGFATGTLIYAIIVLTLGVLWFLLPFAVFGMKPKLDAMLVEMRKANALLELMASQQATLAQQQKLTLTRTQDTLSAADNRTE